MDIGIMKRHRVLSGLAGAAALASMVHAQQIPDLDEDGRISFDEFALALRNRLQNQPIRDLDGNGMIDEQEFRQAIVDLWHVMQGDVNGDGVIDEDDLAIVGANQGLVDVPYTVGDPDLDGDVDIDDFLLTLAQMGSPVVGDDDEAVRTIALVAAYAATIGTAESPVHHTYFSSTWPPDHNGAKSDFWPPDHSGGISGQWERDDLTHNILQSELWPGNHLYVYSQMWDQSSHVVETSTQVWPSNHWFRVSLDWPDDHAPETSRTWPSNHQVGNSALQEPSDHHAQPSSRWLHAVDLSSERWPPNHDRTMSGGWQTHDRELSLLWPPNHFSGPSSTWPDDTHWSANHFLYLSKSQGLSPRDVRFPPDHDYGTTFRDAIDMLTP